jgi:triacylglycerol esterase/lipase EstA (alpha/beta hydrolase family)
MTVPSPKQVNIVGHSKGGLDARVFLANNAFTNNKAVANLIMIGTPNAGSPIAQSSNICKPAVEDLTWSSRYQSGDESKYKILYYSW